MVRQESAKLLFVGSIPTRASIVLLFLAQLSWAADPGTIFQSALAAKEALFPQIKNYFGREDIRYFRTPTPGKRKQTGWFTYEVLTVDNRPVFRLAARDGKPIKENLRKARTQPGESGRVSFRFEDLALNHTLKIDGEEIVLGRKCWRLVATLAPGAPDNLSPSAGMSASDATIWIDQETHWILREEASLRRTWNAFPEGSTVQREFLFHEGLPLTGRVRMFRRPSERLTFETDQVYSNYKRFAAESSIDFTPIK